MKKCPATTDKVPGVHSSVGCVLDDSLMDHYLGHEGFDDRVKGSGGVVNWPVTTGEKKRWSRVDH